MKEKNFIILFSRIFLYIVRIIFTFIPYYVNYKKIYNKLMQRSLFEV